MTLYIYFKKAPRALIISMLLGLWTTVGFATDLTPPKSQAVTLGKRTSPPPGVATYPSQQTPTAQSQNGSTARTWTLNQHNSDIREFIAQVAKITGETFIVDPRIKNNNSVTVISPKPLTKDEVYDIFLEVLATNGYTVIPKGRIINIVPSNSAKTTSPDQNARGNIVMSTRIIQLHSIPAMEVMPLIRPLIAQHGHAAASASGNTIVVSDFADNVKRITKLARDLDEASNNDFEVIPLKHAWVGDISKIIQSTLNAAKSGYNSPASGLQVIPDERGNRLVIKGNADKRIRVRKLVESLDQKGTGKTTTKVIFLDYADANNIATILTEASTVARNNSSPAQKSTNMSKDDISSSSSTNGVFVKADETQNALIIIADPETLSSLEMIVRKLDIPRAQVLIEAAIVEVSGSIDDALGIQWGTDGTNTTRSGTGVLSSVTGHLLDNSTVKMGQVALRGHNFGVLVNALSQKNNNNILSTPSLLTLDNQEAEFLVGKNIPIKTGSYTNSGGSGGGTNPFTTTDRRDIGIKLKITPNLNKDKRLKLRIEQDVSSLSDEKLIGGESDVVYNNRTLKTAVMVDDKQTIVVGGLIQDDRSKSRSKVPVLGDIPLFGNLFKFNRSNSSKRNLMLFIRPTIVRDSKTIDKLTAISYSRLKTVQRKELDIRNDYFPLSPSELFEQEAFDVRSKDKWLWQ